MSAYGALNSFLSVAEDQSLRISANARGNTTDTITISGRHTNQVHTDIGTINDDDILLGHGVGLKHQSVFVDGFLSFQQQGSGSVISFEDRLTENISGSAGPGGTSYLTENVSGTSGPGGTTFPVQTFEPLAEFNSFGEAPNPVFAVGGSAGPGGTSYLTENVLVSASHGGDDI